MTPSALPNLMINEAPYLGTVLKKRAPKGSVKGFHPCPTCNIVYENKTGKEKFCSKECRPAAVKKPCEVCATEFISKKKSERHCSIVCRKIDNNARIQASRDPANNVQCLICGELHKTLASHLKNKHGGMSTMDYQAKFPGAKTITGSTSAIHSARSSGANNPWANHGGALSVFSTKFSGYADLSEEDKAAHAKSATQKYVLDVPKENRPASLQYWLNKGLTEEEAKIALKNHQSTFSLGKCIVELGEEAGLIRWQERQDKWQAKLNSKSDEEIARINRAKMGGFSGSISAISKALFTEITVPGARWGALADGNGGEVMVRTPQSKVYMLDFVVGKKCIEFNGDFWHANPNKYEAARIFKHSNRVDRTAAELWNLDAIKHQHIRDAGYDLLVIWESDFRKDPEGIIQKCKEFLTT